MIHNAQCFLRVDCGKLRGINKSAAIEMANAFKKSVSEKLNNARINIVENEGSHTMPDVFLLLSFTSKEQPAYAKRVLLTAMQDYGFKSY